MVVGLYGLLQHRKRDAVQGECMMIWHYFKGAHHAAQRIDIGHAGQGAQGGPNHPIQNGAALLQGEVFAFHREHEYFTQWRGDRSEPAADIGGQVALRIIQPFRDLLARPVDVGALIKIDGNVGDCILCSGAQNLLVRDTEHLQFDRGDNARFDLFRGHARSLHDDLYLCRGNIGECIYRQVAVRRDAYAGQQQR